MDTAPSTLKITQDAPAVFHAPSCSLSALDLFCCAGGAGMSTPETDEMASMRRTHQEWQAHGEKLERERDEAREKLSELIEEEKTLRYGLRTLSENAAEKRIEISDRLDRALAERDEARASLAAAESWSATLADVGDDFRALHIEMRNAVRNLRDARDERHAKQARDLLFGLLMGSSQPEA